MEKTWKRLPRNLRRHGQVHQQAVDKEMNIEKYENTRWLELIDDIDGLTELSMDIWKQRLDLPQYDYTGKIDLNFNDLIAMNPPEEPFHNQTMGKIVQTLHDGMVKNNQIGRHEFESSHPIHQAINEKFGVSKTQVYLNVQSPGNVCGIHVDKYRTHMTRGEHDFSCTLTKDIFSGVVFCEDWQIGQVFISGSESITRWKQGDTYTFPWYIPHGSANAGAHNRYLIQFVGELTKK